MTQVWTYSVGDHPDYHEPDSRFVVPTKQTLLTKKTFTPGAEYRDFEVMAEVCAEDWFSNHDGWEASWPQEVRIYENGALVAKVSVEMEARPHFSGYEMSLEPTP